VSGWRPAADQAAAGAERIIGLTWRNGRRLTPAADRFNDIVARVRLTTDP
jgi:hypothetical protein